MATVAVCGYKGSITGGLGSGGEISKWNMDLDIDVHDVSSMGSDPSNAYAANIGCLKSGSGTFETLTVCGALGLQSSVVLSDGTSTFTLNLIVESVDTDVDVNGVVKFTYAFKSTGEIQGF